ncbi:insulinase family protein [Desulfovibrio litoralis]|uniref:Pre-sequence protease. Metallo peptidase. MEROPS family M16C n=1 Tax=Desulfovibrio litoralis DSM 11393 TaxID=1121455 RepID=A0A1M7S650_9BACT|nr:insulinase family protein [Desulfovibrio litoralis]SHN53893.1 pre-sequence protease. Metallo peptidase. MEROPS family M16C [Desulfovibrio litoralis DSM 11393]
MNTHGFELIFERKVPEINSLARLWKHKKSGAELLSLQNSDENKVFGVTFRTPPKDSTGVPHILEHSVLCGSKKYPVKEPFVELLKGSLQTFLNAFTYPDKTCYPVASTNLADFYNLVDVYLDAVFYPRISEDIFKQEGWHLEVDEKTKDLSYKGVVYNEMKGVFSSPDSLLSRQAQQALFPDTPYGVESGGDPENIPDLTYKQFKEFHESYYHPSNARFYFWGDDNEDKRLELLDNLLKEFNIQSVDSHIPLQKHFKTPRLIESSYAVEPDNADNNKAFVSMNWLLANTSNLELNFALRMLEHILLGLPASPLRKALLESGLGEDVIDDGLETELRQLCFSVGLKGIDPNKASEVELLIMDTLAELAEEGINTQAIEAAFNTIEFSLREKNTGRFPVGLAVMLQSLTNWLYDQDPLAPLEYEQHLNKIKQKLNSDPRYFEGLIKEYFLENNHYATVLLLPDTEYLKRVQEKEEKRLKKIAEKLKSQDLEKVAKDAEHLKILQETPDNEADLAKIPRLSVADLPLKNKEIVIQSQNDSNIELYFHPQPSSGIVYLNIAFKLNGVKAEQIPLLTILGRALTEMGTKKRSFLDFNLDIASKTGGINAGASFFTNLNNKAQQPYFIVSGKATLTHVKELYALIEELLTEPNFDDAELLGRMLLEEKAKEEHSLIPSGHIAVLNRVKAGLSTQGWLEDQASGLSYLFKLRQMTNNNPTSLVNSLKELLQTILKTPGMAINITAEAEQKDKLTTITREFIANLPKTKQNLTLDNWTSEQLPTQEALLVPAQVNYVAKGFDLFKLGYKYHGSMQVILKHLRTSWLWEKVRVQGGAYGAFCTFDRANGVFAQASYRDPNVPNTINVFDASAEYLASLKLSQDDLAKSIIGAIGELDTYLLPDAKGYSSFIRTLTGDNNSLRQQMRDEILSTTSKDFNALGEIMKSVKTSHTVALGGEEVKKLATAQNWIQTKVL